MKGVINPKAEAIFTEKTNIALYTFKSNSYGVIEHGIDTHGRIYFHQMNGNTFRYTRREFSEMAKEAIRITDNVLNVHGCQCVKIDNLFYFM